MAGELKGNLARPSESGRVESQAKIAKVAMIFVEMWMLLSGW
jgi:hypothetical protein